MDRPFVQTPGSSQEAASSYKNVRALESQCSLGGSRSTLSSCLEGILLGERMGVVKTTPELYSYIGKVLIQINIQAKC